MVIYIYMVYVIFIFAFHHLYMMLSVRVSCVRMLNVVVVKCTLE